MHKELDSLFVLSTGDADHGTHERTPRRTPCTPRRLDARAPATVPRLSRGVDVRRACSAVGLSREAAYKLERREPAFARAWDEALRAARQAAEEAFLAMLPERLLMTMSELSGECELRGAGNNSRALSGL